MALHDNSDWSKNFTDIIYRIEIFKNDMVKNRTPLKFILFHDYVVNNILKVNKVVYVSFPKNI